MTDETKSDETAEVVETRTLETLRDADDKVVGVREVENEPEAAASATPPPPSPPPNPATDPVPTYTHTRNGPKPVADPHAKRTMPTTQRRDVYVNPRVRKGAAKKK